MRTKTTLKLFKFLIPLLLIGSIAFAGEWKTRYNAQTRKSDWIRGDDPVFTGTLTADTFFDGTLTITDGDLSTTGTGTFDRLVVDSSSAFDITFNDAFPVIYFDVDADGDLLIDGAPGRSASISVYADYGGFVPNLAMIARYGGVAEWFSSTATAFQVSADVDDYIQFQTVANIPEITTVGDCDLKITSSSGEINFDDDNLTTTGTGTFGNIITDPTSYAQSILGIKTYGYGTYDAKWVGMFVNSDGSLRIDSSGETTLGFYSGGTAKAYLGLAGSTTGLGITTAMYLKVGSSGTNYGTLRATSSTGGFFEIKSYGATELEFVSNTDRITIVGASGTTGDPQLRFYSGNRGYLTWMEDEKRFNLDGDSTTSCIRLLSTDAANDWADLFVDANSVLNIATNGNAGINVGANPITTTGTLNIPRIDFTDNATYIDRASGDGWVNIHGDVGVEINAPILNIANLYANGNAEVTGDVDCVDVELGSDDEHLVYPTFSVSGGEYEESRTVTIQFVDYGGTNVSKNIHFTFWVATASMGSTLLPSAQYTLADGGDGFILNYYGGVKTYYPNTAVTNSSGSSQITLTTIGIYNIVYFHVANPTDGKVYVVSFLLAPM